MKSLRSRLDEVIEFNNKCSEVSRELNKKLNKITNIVFLIMIPVLYSFFTLMNYYDIFSLSTFEIVILSLLYFYINEFVVYYFTKKSLIKGNEEYVIDISFLGTRFFPDYISLLHEYEEYKSENTTDYEQELIDIIKCDYVTDNEYHREDVEHLNHDILQERVIDKIGEKLAKEGN